MSFTQDSGLAELSHYFGGDDLDFTNFSNQQPSFSSSTFLPEFFPGTATAAAAAVVPPTQNLQYLQYQEVKTRKITKRKSTTSKLNSSPIKEKEKEKEKEGTVWNHDREMTKLYFDGSQVENDLLWSHEGSFVLCQIIKRKTSNCEPVEAGRLLGIGFEKTKGSAHGKLYYKLNLERMEEFYQENLAVQKVQKRARENLDENKNLNKKTRYD